MWSDIKSFWLTQQTFWRLLSLHGFKEGNIFRSYFHVSVCQDLVSVRIKMKSEQEQKETMMESVSHSYNPS